MAVIVPLRQSQPAPASDPEALFEEARRRQRRRRARLSLLEIVVAAAAGALYGGFRSGPEPAATPVTYRSEGIVVRHPSGWYIGNQPMHGWTNPVQRFVLSSYRVPNGANDGGSYSPPSGGAIAELLEEQTPGPNLDRSVAARPRAFSLPRLSDRLEGFGNSWGEEVFREHGREFYLFIGVGRGTPSAVVDELLHILDGMTIAKS